MEKSSAKSKWLMGISAFCFLFAFFFLIITEPNDKNAQSNNHNMEKKAKKDGRRREDDDDEKEWRSFTSFYLCFSPRSFISNFWLQSYLQSSTLFIYIYAQQTNGMLDGPEL